MVIFQRTVFLKSRKSAKIPALAERLVLQLTEFDEIAKTNLKTSHPLNTLAANKAALTCSGDKLVICRVQKILVSYPHEGNISYYISVNTFSQHFIFSKETDYCSDFSFISWQSSHRTDPIFTELVKLTVLMIRIVPLLPNCPKIKKSS